jgi:hypothetical protein
MRIPFFEREKGPRKRQYTYAAAKVCRATVGRKTSLETPGLNCSLGIHPGIPAAQIKPLSKRSCKEALGHFAEK